MRKLMSGSTVALLVAMGFVVALAIHAQTAPSGEKKTLTGVVSDTMCAKKHMAKDKPDADCTRMCVKNGNGFALIVGDDVYALKGHSAELDKYAAQKVTVTGTVTGKSVAVESVTPQQ